MKKRLFRLALIGCILSTSLFIGGAALAQDEELPDPGLTPDSPFYFMDKFSKGLGMAFAFGNEAKARRALEYAEERLAEIQATHTDSDAQESAAEDYNRYMARVRQRIEQADQQGISDNITERFAAATGKHLGVLENIRKAASEWGIETPAADEAVDTLYEGRLSALRALSRNKPERAVEISEQLIEEGLDWALIRSRANDTESVDYAIERTERLADLENELISAAEEAGVDPARLRQRLAQATTNRLEVLAEVHERAPEQARAGLENAIENSVRKYERAVEKLREENAMGNTPEESPALQRLSEAVKNRLRTATAERLQAASGNVTDNASVQTRTRAEVREEVKQKVETRRDTRTADGNSGNATGDNEQEEETRGRSTNARQPSRP